MARINALQLDEKVKEFEARAEQLSKDLGAKIYFEYFVDKSEDGNVIVHKEDDKEFIDVYVAYLRPPSVLILGKAMDMFMSKQYYQCGQMLEPTCVVKDHSDKEAYEDDNRRVGLWGKMGTNLDVQYPELKKK